MREEADSAWAEKEALGAGGRGGKRQLEQNAPRAKKFARAPPRAVPRVYCMRREGANAAGRREEGGERRVERDRDAAPT